jgi:hypothetical protein
VSSTEGPLDLVLRVAGFLDGLGIDYALGGSMASSFFGEPRATMDVDIAIRVDPTLGEALLEQAGTEFYVPRESARRAFDERDSFNLIPYDGNLKVDLFVLGDGLLDRRQIERRQRVALPERGAELWVTSPEDQLLRKLTWHALGDSEKQWRDVIGILRVSAQHLDLVDLRETAAELGLSERLEEALAQARLDEP